MGLSLAFTMLSRLICLFYMYGSQYDANQGNIQSHFLLSQRWMLEQDGRSGNNTGCISHSILSLVLTVSCVPMQQRCNASDLTSLCILSNRSHKGLGNMSTDITIYSPILISVSTHYDVGLIVLPLLHSFFCFCFVLSTKARRKKETRGLI